MSAIFAAGGNPLDFLTQFGVEWQLLVSQGVSFAIVAAALYRFVFKPVIAASDERKRRIEQGLKSSTPDATAPENVRQAYSSKLKYFQF